LEKNANITLKSTLLPEAVLHGEEERPDSANYGADAVIMLYATSFTYSFICGERRNAVQVFGLGRPERRESGTRTRKA
jgi:hypothetical protein